MTSQKSTNHNSICLLSLIREDMRHKTWLLALSILGSFLAGPVAALFFMGRAFEYSQRLRFIGDSVYDRYGDFLMTIAEYYQEKLRDSVEYLLRYHFTLSFLVAVAGAILVALCGFRFLYHKQMVDLYHSAPVSRKKLFVAVWLSGFLIWLLPALVSGFLVFIILIIYAEGTCFATIFVNLLLCMLRLTLCFLIVYNACLVAAMFSGNELSAVVGSLSYGFIVSMCVFAYQILEETFYDNCFVPRNYMYSHPLYAFSPLLTPFLLAIKWVYAKYVTNFYCWHLIAGIAIMILNFFLAFLLYLKRPSELAERGIECKPIRIALRTLVSIVGGIGFTMILYAVSEHQIGWMLFGAFFGSALAFVVINVICHGTFKEAFSHKLQYVFVLAACMLLFFGTYFDVTGYGKRLPKADDITGISIMNIDVITDSNRSYELVNGKLVTDNSNGSDTIVMSRNSGQIHDLLAACVNHDNESFNYVLSMNVKVNTKWGSYYRRYHLEVKDAELLAPIVETKEFREAYYPIATMRFGLPSQVELVSSIARNELIMDKDRIAQLMEAYRQDFEEHSGLPDLLRESRKFSLRFYFPSGDTDRGGNVTFNKDIPYWYEHTISLVESWYPKKAWDPTLKEAEAFYFYDTLPITNASDAPAAIFNNFGFDAQGNPLSVPPKNPNMEYVDSDTIVSWDFELKDLTALYESEPFMIWGHYNDMLTSEYTLLGAARLEEGGYVECYIRYGKLSKEILDELLRNMTIETYSWDSDVPLEAYPVKEYYYYD